MINDLVGQIEDVVQRAQKKVLVKYSIPYNTLLNAQECPVFNPTSVHKPIKEKVGLIAITGEITCLLDEVLAMIISNLHLSCVIDNPEVITDVHLLRKNSNEPIEILLFQL